MGSFIGFRIVFICIQYSSELPKPYKLENIYHSEDLKTLPRVTNSMGN